MMGRALRIGLKLDFVVFGLFFSFWELKFEIPRRARG